MRFPVTRDPGNFSEVIELDLSEVDFIETHSSGYVVFHRGEETFYPLIPKLSVLESHLERFGFLRLDRTNLSNIGKIRRFDEERLLVYFSDTVTKTSKFSTVSARMKRTLKERLASRYGKP